jgi:hypothetical protein
LRLASMSHAAYRMPLHAAYRQVLVFVFICVKEATAKNREPAVSASTTDFDFNFSCIWLRLQFQFQIQILSDVKLFQVQLQPHMIQHNRHTKCRDWCIILASEVQPAKHHPR